MCFPVELASSDAAPLLLRESGAASPVERMRKLWRIVICGPPPNLQGKYMYSVPLRCPHCGSENTYTFLSVRRNQSFTCKTCSRAIVMTQELMEKIAPPPSAESIADTGPSTPTPGIK